MSKPTSSLIFKTFLGFLGVLSLSFIAALAVADPKCAHCTAGLIQWAMPRAEILTGGWFFAGSMLAWDHRRSIKSKLVAALQHARRLISPAKMKAQTNNL